MSDTKKKTRLTTARGVASWAYLTRPDTKYVSEGEFKLKVSIPGDDAKAMCKVIDAEVKANYAEVKAANDGKRVKIGEPSYTVDENTGEVTINAKMKAKVTPKNGKEPFTQKPALFDAQGKPLPSTVRVGNGSIVRVTFELVPYFTKLLGAGVSLRLLAVQVIKLVEFGGASGSKFGFDAESDGDCDADDIGGSDTTDDEETDEDEGDDEEEAPAPKRVGPQKSGEDF